MNPLCGAHFLHTLCWSRDKVYQIQKHNSTTPATIYRNDETRPTQTEHASERLIPCWRHAIHALVGSRNYVPPLARVVARTHDLKSHSSTVSVSTRKVHGSVRKNDPPPAAGYTGLFGSIWKNWYEGGDKRSHVSALLILCRRTDKQFSYISIRGTNNTNTNRDTYH